MLLTENTIPEVCQVLCASQVLLLFFYHSGFFPTYFSGVPKVLLGCHPCPPQGHCALTAKGEGDPRSHCSTLIWSRCSFETVSAISATSHVPVWIANLLFFFPSPSPLLSRKFTELVLHLLPKIELVEGKQQRDAESYQGSLHLSCQLQLGRDFLLKKDFLERFFIFFLWFTWLVPLFSSSQKWQCFPL